MLNTSDEVRGMTLQEVADADITVEQTPRTHTILFETDDVLGIRDRAAAAGHQIVEPVLGDIPETERPPGYGLSSSASSTPMAMSLHFFST